MISVIIPVYNVEKYIYRCVESVLKQTISDFEIILVDDGSTDNSGIICDQLVEVDSRISVIHKENGGLASARNKGTANAKGEYITYIDSDDFVSNSYLETLYQNAIAYHAQISVCTCRKVWDKDKPNLVSSAKYKVSIYSGREAASQIVKENNGNMIVAWGKLYHSCLKDVLFYPDGKLHEDEFVTYKVLYASDKVVVTDAPYYQYFQRDGSIMNAPFNVRRLDKLKALKEAISYFEANGDEELKYAAIKRYLLNIQIAWYRVNKYMKKEEYIQTELKKEWEEIYQQRQKILQICGMVDKISIWIFSISPKMYCIITELITRIFPEL